MHHQLLLSHNSPQASFGFSHAPALFLTMVVLSVALCSKSGKYLLARQFIEISRIRIEGLLAAFPKLLSSGKEHTFVETDQVRYV